MRNSVHLLISQHLKQLQTLKDIVWFFKLLAACQANNNNNNRFNLHHIVCCFLTKNHLWNCIMKNIKTRSYALQIMQFIEIEEIIRFILQLHGSMLQLFWFVKHKYDYQTLQDILIELQNRTTSIIPQSTNTDIITQILRNSNLHYTFAQQLDWTDSLHLSQCNKHFYVNLNHQNHIKKMVSTQIILTSVKMHHLIKTASVCLFAWPKVQDITITAKYKQKQCNGNCQWCVLMHKVCVSKHKNFEISWMHFWLSKASSITTTTTWPCINNYYIKQSNKQSITFYPQTHPISMFSAVYDQIKNDINSYYSINTQIRLFSYQNRFYIQNNHDGIPLLLKIIPLSDIENTLRNKQFFYFRHYKQIEFKDALIVNVTKTMIKLQLFNPIQTMKINICDIISGFYQFAQSMLSMPQESHSGLCTPTQSQQQIQEITGLYPHCLQMIAQMSISSLDATIIKFTKDKLARASSLFGVNSDFTDKYLMLLSPCLKMQAFHKYELKEICNHLDDGNSCAFGIICMQQDAYKTFKLELFQPYRIPRRCILKSSNKHVNTHDAPGNITEFVIYFRGPRRKKQQINLNFINTFYNQNYYQLNLTTNYDVSVQYTIQPDTCNCYIAMIIDHFPKLDGQNAEFALTRLKLPTEDIVPQIQLPKQECGKLRPGQLM